MRVPGSARAARVSPFAVVVASLLFTALLMSATPASGAGDSGSVAMFDDDGGGGLFTAARPLAPGTPQVACVSVGVLVPKTDDRIELKATQVAGTLIGQLTVTVDIGTGGEMGDCSGFTGSRLWSGRLADLTAGINTGWQPWVVDTRSFRFTVEVDDDATAIGRAATGRFVWGLTRDTPEPTGTDPTGTDPTRTGPTRTGPTGTGPTGTASGPTNTQPSSTPDTTSRSGPGVPVRPDGIDPLDGQGVPGDPPSIPPSSGEAQGADVVLGVPLGAISATAKRATAVALEVVKKPQYPLSALMLAGLFLLLQDMIDRRDPKLAVARMTARDDRLVFPDLFAPRGFS